MRTLLIFLLMVQLGTGAHAAARGSGSFENDDAYAWIATCSRSTGAKEVTAALQVVLRPGYLEATEASVTVAAAEVVAAALGKPSPTLPEKLRQWIERQPKQGLAELAPMARQALVRVKDPKQSELRQLWSESKSEQWLASIADLELRLGK